MIEEKDLKDRVKYFYEHTLELHLGSEPKPMFENGVFSTSNWNGGDAIIRQFCYMLENNHFGEFVTYGNNEEQLVCKFYRYEDETYVSIVHIQTVMNNEQYETNIDNYEFSWYKNRGRINKAASNGNVMTEFEYITLLNTIEDLADFKFILEE